MCFFGFNVTYWEKSMHYGNEPDSLMWYENPTNNDLFNTAYLRKAWNHAICRPAWEKPLSLWHYFLDVQGQKNSLLILFVKQRCVEITFQKE